MASQTEISSRRTTVPRDANECELASLPFNRYSTAAKVPLKEQAFPDSEKGFYRGVAVTLKGNPKGQTQHGSPASDQFELRNISRLGQMEVDGRLAFWITCSRIARNKYNILNSVKEFYRNQKYLIDSRMMLLTVSGQVENESAL